MIFVEAGKDDERGLDAKVQFAHLLRQAGYHAVLECESLAEGLTPARQYLVAPLLADLAENAPERLLVIGGDGLEDSVLERIRSYRLRPDTPAALIGRFENRQAAISAQSKLAYALGYEPQLVDLCELQPKPIRAPHVAPLFAVSAPAPVRRAQQLRLFMVLPEEILEDPSTPPVLDTLAQMAHVECRVITSGHGRELMRKQGHPLPSAIGFSDLAPTTLAGMADILAIFGPSLPGEQMAAFSLNLMARGGVVIDATSSDAIVQTGAPVLRGPYALAGLRTFLENQVLPNLEALRNEMAGHPWLQASDLSRLENALGMQRPKPAETGENVASGTARRVIFNPTNGVGLGHAQRAAVVASALGDDIDAGFAAFPSCLPMLQAKGFNCLPLVSRSDDFNQPHANDLLNYLRLGQLLTPRDTLIFDGGYVFDSVLRNIVEKQLRAVWIRRGLWQAGQARRTPLEREIYFDKVIVPQEAFDELNIDYSFGKEVHHVGPVVQLAPQNASARAALRAGLAQRFGRDYTHLVVTMLGGGVAADRTAQMQTLCAQIAAHPDWLHLMVVWPNGKVGAPLYGWENSFPVMTQRALGLAQAADVLVSAAGYNSVHEVLYHGIATIFIPQMASYMDDQERRARALSDRDLAVTVSADELMALQRHLADFLEGDKAAEIRANLQAQTLPDTGTERAARLVEEVAGYVR